MYYTFKFHVEQMVQFHDTIYEKWNIKKLSALKTTDWIQNKTTSLESNEQVSTSIEFNDVCLQNFVLSNF